MDDYFTMSIPVSNEEYPLIISCVNQGIDARLEGFTRSEFKYIVTNEFIIHGDLVQQTRLQCQIAIEELQILIRRLLELATDDAENLADNIIYVKYGHEII